MTRNQLSQGTPGDRRSTQADRRSTRWSQAHGSTQADMRSTQAHGRSSQADRRSSLADMRSTQPDRPSTLPDRPSTQPDGRSRLSDGSALPPPPSSLNVAAPSILGPRISMVEKQSQDRDQELHAAVESLSNRVSDVEKRSNTGWRDASARVLVEQRVPSLEECQKDHTLQIKNLRTEFDERAVDTKRAIDDNTASILEVKESEQRREAFLTTTVRELKDEVLKHASDRTTRLNDHEERLASLEKQTQVEGARKRQAEFQDLSKRLSQAEKDRDQEREKNKAMKKQVNDMMGRLHRLEAKSSQDLRFSDLPRPSSSASNRNSLSGLLTARRDSAQEHERSRPSKRQATPTESPTRLNAVKRTKTKGPPQTPAGTDNDIDSDEQPLMSSQSRRTRQASKPATPNRSNLQPAAQQTAASNERPAANEQPTATESTTATNGASTPKSKKVKPEQAAKTTKRSREATPEGLTKVAKDKFRYIRELKDFDCTDFPKYKPLREDYLAATHQFPLFKLEIRNEIYEFFLQTGEKNTVEPSPREQVIGIPKETKQSDNDREIVKSLGILEACRFGSRGRVIEKGSHYYLLCLGEIYKSVQNSRNNKKESTGWFIFIDVATKDKPVYMIWREKTFKDDKLVSTSNWVGATMGLQAGDRRDFFVLLPSIKDWPKDPEQRVVSDERIKVVLDTRGQGVHAVFTSPMCESLVQRVEEGWNKSVTFKETVRAGPARAKD